MTGGVIPLQFKWQVQAVHYLICNVGALMRIDCVTPHHCVYVCDNFQLQFSEAAICCVVYIYVW